LYVKILQKKSKYSKKYSLKPIIKLKKVKIIQVKEKPAYSKVQLTQVCSKGKVYLNVRYVKRE